MTVKYHLSTLLILAALTTQHSYLSASSHIEAPSAHTSEAITSEYPELDECKQWAIEDEVPEDELEQYLERCLDDKVNLEADKDLDTQAQEDDK